MVFGDDLELMYKKVAMLEAENEWLWEQNQKFKEFRQLIADEIMKIERG